MVGPDAEIRTMGERSGGARRTLRRGAETRRGIVRSISILLIPQFAGRPVLLVDDIVSSGGTLIACAKALAAAGAVSVDAVVTHALFPPDLISELFRNGIRSIR